MPDRQTAQARGVVDALRSAVRGEVDASRRRRAEYSSDASNYRVVPEVVVFPRDIDDVLVTAELARRRGSPRRVRRVRIRTPQPLATSAWLRSRPCVSPPPISG